LLKTSAVGFDKSRVGPDELYKLADAYGARGPDVVAKITSAKRIVFHAIGDSGATTEGKQYGYELSVTDQLTMDCNITEVANRPAFLLHLGDVVYDFGESQQRRILMRPRRWGRDVILPHFQVTQNS
jgi:hypothetical protein